MRPAIEAHVLKSCVLLLPIQEVRRGKRIIARRRFGLVKAHQLARLAEGKRLYEDSVDHAENRGVGADTKGQRYYCDGGEPARLLQIAKGKADILKKGFHGKPRCLGRSLDAPLT